MSVVVPKRGALPKAAATLQVRVDTTGYRKRQHQIRLCLNAAAQRPFWTGKDCSGDKTPHSPALETLPTTVHPYEMLSQGGWWLTDGWPVVDSLSIRVYRSRTCCINCEACERITLRFAERCRELDSICIVDISPKGVGPTFHR